MADLSKFEERLQKLECIHERGAGDPVREIQKELLEELYHIRETLIAEQVNISANSEVQKEIDNLRDENQRLKYRIEHLKRHVVTNA